MQTIHALGKALIVSLLATLSRNTSSGNGTGVDIRDYAGTGMFVLAAGAATAGTNPTLDISFEESDDNSTWSAIPAADYDTGTEFTQVTTVASFQVRKFDVSKRKRYVRIAYAIGGTATPAFPFGVAFVGQKQYA